MAGMGFELRKIYGRKTLAANIWGTVYATMTTIGPAILSAALIILLKFTLDQSGLTNEESKFFIASTTYAFLVATLVSALLNTPVSRYISDCIFLEKDEDICSSLFGVLALAVTISGIIMIGLCVATYAQHDGISEIFLVNYYFLGVLVTCTYCVMTYASALKRYKELTFGFFLGFVVAVSVFVVLYQFSNLDRVTAACIALTCCYFVIVLAMAIVCMRSFGLLGKKYFGFMSYLTKYPALTFSGFAYTLGMFCPTIIFWMHSTVKESISIFSTTPTFDLALFFAIVVNMPSLVIFVVKVETAFYEKFTEYVSALNNGSHALIEREREVLARELRNQLLFVYEVQLVITIVLICFAVIIVPGITASSEFLSWFVVLSIAVYVTFCMYFTVVVFYYFSDYRGAAVSTLVFLLTTTACAVVCSCLGGWYSAPLLIGGITGWVVSFVLLRRRMERLNSFLLSI